MVNLCVIIETITDNSGTVSILSNVSKGVTALIFAFMMGASWDH